MANKCIFSGANCGGTWNASNGDCECPPDSKPKECQEKQSPKLNMYESDEGDMVIAENEEEALKIVREFYDPEDESTEEIGVELVADENKQLTVNDDGTVKIMSVAQWIATEGKGYLAGVNF